MMESLQAVFLSLGYTGIVLLLAADECLPLVPIDALLPFVGFLAATGAMNLPEVILSAVAGSVIGQMVLYGLARWGRESVILTAGHLAARVRLVSQRDLNRAEAWFLRWGGAAVFAARLLPLGSLVAIPAGVCRMPLGRFLTYVTLGSAAWSSTLITLGWIVAEEWARVVQIQLSIQTALLAAITVTILVIIARRRARAR
ncbi:MAG: DedA family protein [Chloroflexota bacterium]